MSKQLQFLHILFAFGHFAGKSLKVNEAAEALSPDTLNEMQYGLLQIAAWCRKQDAKEWPDLEKLAFQIETEISR